MDHALGRDALRLWASVPDLIVIGRSNANVIRNRATDSVDFDTHADLTAIGKNLVLILIDHIGVDELQSKPEGVSIVLDKENKALAIPSNAFDKYALAVDPREATVYSANSGLPPSIEGRFESLIRYLIECAVWFSRTNLQCDPFRAYDVRIYKVKVSTSIIVVLAKVA
jgi:hypothetical protein